MVVYCIEWLGEDLAGHNTGPVQAALALEKSP
jgi:hypothetical protein